LLIKAKMTLMNIYSVDSLECRFYRGFAAVVDADEIPARTRRCNWL